MTLWFTEGPLAGKELTASTGPWTTFTVGDQPCAPTSVPAGSTVEVVVVKDDAGTSTVRLATLVHAG